MKPRHILIFLLLLSFFAPVGCEKEASTVVLAPYSQPSVDKKAITVNIASHTIHLDSTCPHVEKAKEENLRTVDDTSDDVNTLLSMGYHICADCYDE